MACGAAGWYLDLAQRGVRVINLPSYEDILVDAVELSPVRPAGGREVVLRVRCARVREIDELVGHAPHLAGQVAVRALHVHRDRLLALRLNETLCRSWLVMFDDRCETYSHVPGYAQP